MEPYHPNCPDCKLYKPGQPELVEPCGNPDADLVLVGEAPGRDEVRRGEPFVGQAGDLLNSLLDKVGIRREEIWITNTILCRPPANDMKRAGNAVEMCRDRLLSEIEDVEPNVVVPMGATALKALAKREPITKWRGSIMEVELWTRKS